MGIKPRARLGFFMGHSRLFFFYFRLFYLMTVNKCSIKKFAYDWIRTSDLRCRKRQLYQLSHNYCPKTSISL